MKGKTSGNTSISEKYISGPANLRLFVRAAHSVLIEGLGAL